jgi:hypothetical protein
VKALLRAARRALRRRRALPAPPAAAGHRFLFICGLHRSGTSILHRLLRQHPEVSGFSDTPAPEDEGQHLQTVFPPAYRLGGPGRFAFDLRSHLTESSPLATAANRDRLLREWGAYYDLGKEVLLEKSPPNLVRSRFFQALFPGASFLFVVRHPVAVALATQKWAKTSIVELLLHWHAAHAIMLADLAYLGRFRLMRYEDFVASPQAHLEQACRLAGIAGVAPQEPVVDHNPRYFSAWQREYGGELELVQRVVPEHGPLGAFGYSLTEPYVRPWSELHARPQVAREDAIVPEDGVGVAPLVLRPGRER